MIPQHTLDAIKQIPISEVLRPYIKHGLKTRGSRHIGLCPFHSEKTPSFNILDDKGIYKCFGCGKAGDAIGFIQEHEKLSFQESVTAICENHGIEIQKDEEYTGPTESDLIMRALKDAQDLYFGLSRTKGLRSYLDQRDLNIELCDEFGIGYAPSSPDDATQYLLSKGYDVDILIKAGISKRFHSATTDNYRNRVVFPIRNIYGKVVGFSCRVMDDSKPKYINSPQSDVFNKSAILYGLDIAKRYIAEKDMAYITEGATDVMSWHRFGLKNTVCTLGTALSEQHIKAILRYTKNVCMVYDGDQAGLKALFKACEPLMSLGAMVFVLPVPGGVDPDTLAREKRESLEEFVAANTKNVIEYRMTLLSGAIQDKIALAREFDRMIKLCPDPVVRAVLENEYSTAFGINKKKALIQKPIEVEQSKSHQENLLRCMLLYRDEPWFIGYDKETSAFVSRSINDVSNRALYDYLCLNPGATVADALRCGYDNVESTANRVLSKSVTNIDPEIDTKLTLLYCEKHAFEFEKQAQVRGTDVFIQGDPGVVIKEINRTISGINEEILDIVTKINSKNFNY